MGIRSLLLFICLAAASNSFSQLTANAGDNKYICPGESVVMGTTPAATGGLPPYTYLWQPSTSLNSTTIPTPTSTPSASITFTLTVTDDTGAVSTDVAFVYVNDVKYVNAGRDTSICENSNALIGSPDWNIFNWINYSWSPGASLNDSTSPTPIASPGSTSVTYTLTATAPGCPPKIDQVRITVIPTPALYAGPDTTIQEGEVAVLTGTGGFNYAWGNTPDIKYSFSASCDVEPVSTTTYYLYCTDETGKCPAYDEVTVFVEPSDDLVVYNTFTPNNDGNNDTWYIGNIHKYPDCRIELYNRYGKLVFKSTGYNNTWDGRVSGEELPAGTYFYDLNPGPGTPTHHGTLTILR
ncbi:MAG TPA: gliding motility-associated C-terminal domain-containing protein [Bacteroidia bacterium]|jgi:gliding motility-associated-like protein